MAKGKQEHISAQQEYDAIRAHKPVYRLEPWELCEVYAARPEVRTLTYGLLYVLMRDQPEKPFDAMLDFVNSFASEGEVRDPSKEELPPRGCREEDAYRYISNGKIMTFLHHLFTSMFDEQPSGALPFLLATQHFLL